MTLANDSVVAAGRCAEAGCTAATGGPCLREFAEPVECPAFQDDELGTDDELADDQPQEAIAPTEPAPARPGRRPLVLSHDVVPVHSGEALTAAEGSAVLGAHAAELVVAVGEVGAGKTTLFAALYEQLTRGAVPPWQFDGSLSLLGFESRSYEATHASGRAEEDTARTSRNTDRVALHLAVRGTDAQVRHLLLADVSGEHATSLIDTNDPVDYRPLLRSATRVLVLIDGDLLLTPAAQNRALTRMRVLVRALVEGDDLRAGTPLDLVVTKWDSCEGADGVDEQLDRLLSSARALWSSVTLYRTAARPHGSGVADLLDAWLAPRPARPLPQAEPVQPTRPLHRFAPHDGVLTRYLATRGVDVV